MVMVALPVLVHAGQNYRGNYQWAEAYARAALDELPANATLFVAGDIDALPIGYLRLVDGYRDDVTLVPTKALLFRTRPFNPWRAPSAAERKEVLAAYIDQSEDPVCFVGVTSMFGDRYGLRWNGLTSCYDKTRTGVYSATGDAAIERYVELQKLRDADNWSMMAADSLDGHMVRVLIIELSGPASGIGEARLYEAIDQARNGLRGKVAFVDYSLALGLPLSPDETLPLLEEAQGQLERAYVKKDEIDLYLLTVRELERAGRKADIEPILWRAMKLKPTWENALLPRLLTRLFTGREKKKLWQLAELDADLEILKEIYELYETSEPGSEFGFRMQREGLSMAFTAEGTVEIEN